MPPISRFTPRRTVQLRLTVTYGALFLVSGAALLAVTYLLVHQADVGPKQITGPQHNFIPAPGGGASPVPGTGDGGYVPQELAERSTLSILPDDAQQLLAGQKAAMMHELLINSGIALCVMTVLSGLLGWIVAGRILRPLRTITATARDISATSLHRRLGLDGPDDELKELGETFDALLTRLESSFQAQRRFVANASHELRTPLARQRTISEVALADEEASVASLRQAHERVLVAGSQQERLIEALLTLTRSHTGIAVREPFDLARLTHEVVDFRAAEAQHRGVTIRTDIAPAVAIGHRNLAERLIGNLVDNAIKHNVPGGWVEISTASMAGAATLTVRNSGPKIPPEVVEALFEPFHRHDETRAPAEGLGLGLSIVQAIADAHDARIETVARPEGGLAVTVTLPAEGSTPRSS
jgi:signal transduction histidine kinase